MINPDIFVEPQEVQAALAGLKVGDAIIELTPREHTDHADRLARLGLPAVFGCVDGVSSTTEQEPSVTLWSTLFAGQYSELSAFEARTFTPNDISSIAIVKGELYIPQESNGRFALGQRVSTQINDQKVAVTVEGYFDGMVAVRSDDGQRGVGDASFFEPADGRDIMATPTSAEVSKQKIRELSDAANRLDDEFPEFKGMTVFGSVARGKARSNSDVDVFVFVEPGNDFPIQNNAAIGEADRVGRVGGTGAMAATIRFNDRIDLDYKRDVSEVLSTCGIKQSDILVTPISEEIVATTTTELLENARQLESGDFGINNEVPRNIRGLFHVAISDKDLKPYMRQTLETIANSPHGATAWKMIRLFLIGFEKPRAQNNFRDVEHRKIPRTLEQALEFYC